MINQVHYNPGTGQITALVASLGVTKIRPQPDESELILAEPMNLSVDLHYVRDGAIADRPELEIVLPQNAGEAMALATLPQGTRFRVLNEAGDELVLTTFDEPLTLVDAGAYTFEIKPPFPWLPLIKTIEVQNA